MSLLLSLSRSHIRTLVPSIGSFFFHSFFLRIFLTLLQSKCIWIWVDVSVQFLFNVLSCDVYACAAVAVLVYASQIHAIILLLLLHWVYLHCNGVCVASGTYGAKFVHFVCMPFTISSNRQVHPTLCTFPFVFSFLFLFHLACKKLTAYVHLLYHKILSVCLAFCNQKNSLTRDDDD